MLVLVSNRTSVPRMMNEKGGESSREPWRGAPREAAPSLFSLRRVPADPLTSQAIRKKIESELSRKRPTSKRTQRPGGTPSAPRPKQGTVSALRPLPALTVPHSISVADASQLCAAKRTDCVLVVDEEEHLCGIFTAKDLAFRVSCAFGRKRDAADVGAGRRRWTRS